jgi:hypothetical protein
MNAASSTTDRFAPQQPQSAGRGSRASWAATLIALAVLAVLAYQAYAWFASDVAQRAVRAAGREPGNVIAAPPARIAPPQSAPAPGAAGGAPAAITDLGVINDPDQRRSVCGFVAAELQRLDHEFKQPLPLSVIDRIATEIAQWRSQAERYGCAPKEQPPSGSPNTPARRRAAPPPA